MRYYGTPSKRSIYEFGTNPAYCSARHPILRCRPQGTTKAHTQCKCTNRVLTQCNRTVKYKLGSPSRDRPKAFYVQLRSTSCRTIGNPPHPSGSTRAFSPPWALPRASPSRGRSASGALLASKKISTSKNAKRTEIGSIFPCGS